ncbi:MAG: inositol monophosphatase [Burkholderiales bacterium]|nr:inositol monophosphatase [Burkholderiales bacterium]
MIELLDLCKSLATQAGLRLLEDASPDDRSYAHSSELPKEIKAIADGVLEEHILRALVPTGLSVLSEESGYISGQENSKLLFIVDPLDGTFNFVKGLGPSAVSIALWQDRTPVFGVIFNLSNRQLVWGGAGLGSYSDGIRISVSATSDRSKASICTGFPVRFDPTGDNAMQNFWRMVTPFAKVRMLGSAAISLLHVANGSADVYSEQDIMLWDVAAGLAIVEGAGGRVYYASGLVNEPLDVYATNGIIGGPV